MKTIMLRFIIPILTGAMLVMAGTGCNTTDGIGDDIEDLGDEIEDAVD